MIDAHDELWGRINAFDFDDGIPALSFAKRLARENGWSAAFSERVLREYKRFAFLCIVAGHPVTPSEEVDQAWHLHLTYTHSYWGRFCPDALGRALHHNPTRGGDDEQRKFRDWYSKTLASYERCFGEAPPADIWPTVDARFAAAGEARWVNTSRNWVIPKRPMTRTTAIAALLIGIGSMGGCQAAVGGRWNPFDFDGPTFLMFYAILMAIGLCAGLLIRFSTRPAAVGKAREFDDPYEAACLANGPRGVVLAALAALVHRGQVGVREEKSAGWLGFSTKKNWLLREAPLPQDAPDIERRIYDTIADNVGANPKSVIESAVPVAERYEEGLRAEGMLHPHPEESSFVRWLPVMIMVLVIAIGFIKILVGIARDRPVGFLIAMTIGAGVAACILGARKYRTSAGEREFQRLKARHSSLESTVKSGVDLAGPEVVFAVGLFGLAAVHQASALSPLYETLKSEQLLNTGGTYGGGCGGGCGGGGCGGGCGGCGGCGG